MDYSGKNCTLVSFVNFSSLIIFGEEPREPGSEVKETREDRKMCCISGRTCCTEGGGGWVG